LLTIRIVKAKERKKRKEKKKQLDSFAAAVVKSLLIWTQLDCIIIDEEWEIP